MHYSIQLCVLTFNFHSVVSVHAVPASLAVVMGLVDPGAGGGGVGGRVPVSHITFSIRLRKLALQVA